MTSHRLPRDRTGRSLVGVAAVSLGLLAAAVSGVQLASAAGTPARGDSAARLPRAVDAPGTWSDGVRLDGPVAALGIAERTRPVGVWGRTETPTLFTTSARDGRSGWTDLPGSSLEAAGAVGGVAVSPDGRFLGWRRLGAGGGQGLAGWSVMDTSSGRVRRFDVPDGSAVAPASDLAFTGDSRYLLASYEPPRTVATTQLPGHHALVAWSVQDGSRTVLERPGRFFLPELGTARSGAVWARGRQVFRQDVATGTRRTVTLPHEVAAVSWAPRGTAFAYIGDTSAGKAAPWRLYAGRTLARARNRPIPVSGPTPVEVLGWRDSTHVVVGAESGLAARVVDVVTGAQQSLDVAVSAKVLGTPVLATGLWQQPLRSAAAVPGSTDPRGPWRWAVGGLAAVALLALGLLRRRSGRTQGRPTHRGGRRPARSTPRARREPGRRRLTA